VTVVVLLGVDIGAGVSTETVRCFSSPVTVGFDDMTGPLGLRSKVAVLDIIFTVQRSGFKALEGRGALYLALLEESYSDIETTKEI
jgi:hypothetical protein